MMTSTIKQQSAQSLILVPIETKEIGQEAAEASYFTGMLDMGDEIVAPTADTPSPIAHVPAAPTMAAYLIGLLDDGEE
jgi:hypothetical protein